MNLDFALVIFCLTLVTLVAIVYGKDNLAKRALDIFSGIWPSLPDLKSSQEKDKSKKRKTRP